MTIGAGSLDALVERAERSELPEPARDLVLAACLGDDELAAAIGGEAPPSGRLAAADGGAVEPHSIFLASIAVAGLRGIAGEGGATGAGDGRNGARPARLGLRPGPGLTLVVGRNGSGKSSFAEATELALYGTSRRWQDREKAYEGGWANLHHDGPRFVEVRLVEEGLEGETVLRREWPATGELRTGAVWAQRRGGPRLDPAELGLGGEAIAGWRPFLSYNELGSLLDAGPAKLYDSLSAVLGLEDWVEVGERLGAARKLLDERRKRVEQGAKALRAQLAAVEDERAAPALRALPTRGRPDLDALAGLATATPAPGSDLAALEELAALAPLDVEALVAFAGEVRTAERRLAEVAGTDAARALRLAQLLEQALEHHEHEGDGPCPVCKAGSLDATWAEATRAEASHLREAARDADDAARAWRRVRERVPGLLAALPRPRGAVALPEALDSALAAYLARREQLLQAAGEAAALARLVESGAGELAAALERVRAEARAELDRRRDVWQPVASAILGFLPVARLHEAEAPAIDALKRAEDWVANETTIARNERFAPIKAQARECWSELGQQSNVRLDDIVLTGTKTRRRVELGVSVDDYEGVALGVMSQGELHAMALSLFLPRAMLPESPFRFLIVDDPVQAMDAIRVDGLARVLAAAARTHQVVVLTHDARLVEAAERLALGATVLEVVRGEHSQLTVRRKLFPVEGYLDDARAMIRTEACPEDVREKVVPGLCRNALEAACFSLTWRRMLEAGRRHDEIEEALRRAEKLLPRLALALFGDGERAGEVMSEVNRRFGSASGDLVKALNSGAHGAAGTGSYRGDLDEMVRDTERLAARLYQLLQRARPFPCRQREPALLRAPVRVGALAALAGHAPPEELVEKRIGALAVPLVPAVEYVVLEPLSGAEVLVDGAKARDCRSSRVDREDPVFDAALHEQRPRGDERGDVDVLEPAEHSGQHLRSAHVERHGVRSCERRQVSAHHGGSDALVGGGEEQRHRPAVRETNHAEPGRVDEGVGLEQIEGSREIPQILAQRGRSCHHRVHEIRVAGIVIGRHLVDALPEAAQVRSEHDVAAAHELAGVVAVRLVGLGEAADVGLARAVAVHGEHRRAGLDPPLGDEQVRRNRHHVLDVEDHFLLAVAVAVEHLEGLGGKWNPLRHRPEQLDEPLATSFAPGVDGGRIVLRKGILGNGARQAGHPLPPGRVVPLAGRSGHWTGEPGATTSMPPPSGARQAERHDAGATAMAARLCHS